MTAKIVSKKPVSTAAPRRQAAAIVAHGYAIPVDPQESIPAKPEKPFDAEFLAAMVSGKYDACLPFIEAFYAVAMKNGYRMTGRSISMFLRMRKNQNGRK